MNDLAPIGAARPKDRATRSIDALHGTFSRAIAALLILATLVVWARIAGLDLFGTTFSELEGASLLVLGSFAVLLPLAGQGLWMLAPWGRVLWLCAVTLHVAAIANGWWPATFAPIAFAFHAVTVGAFLLIEATRWIDRRRTA